MKRLLMALACTILCSTVFAAGPRGVRKRVQASMLVSGSIEVTSAGGVSRYTLDHPEKLAAEVKALLGAVIPAWKFAPLVVNGKTMTQDAKMSLRIVATPLDDGKYAIAVTGAWFGDRASRQSNVSAQTISFKHRVQPSYPVQALRAGVGGTVYVLLKVGHEGKVVDAVATQVNLRVIASDNQMASWRRVLADAALSALRQSTFSPPTGGAAVDQPYWIAQIPVEFFLTGSMARSTAQQAPYGQWQPYVPGPVQHAPWSGPYQVAGSPDAVPEGGALLAATALRLLTAPDANRVP